MGRRGVHRSARRGIIEGVRTASLYNCRLCNGSTPSSEGAFPDPIYESYVESEVERLVLRSLLRSSPSRPRPWAPRVRFTVRTMMIVVAVAAVLTGGLVQYRRWRVRLHRQALTYRMIASEHALLELSIAPLRRTGNSRRLSAERMASITSKPDPVWQRVAAADREEATRCGRWAAYEANLKMKYLLAAASPWKVVPPDLPPDPRFGPTPHRPDSSVRVKGVNTYADRPRPQNS